MEKRNLIIGTVFIVALIVVVSLFYPPADENESAGTIGKVDKYRNSNTAQEDIQLRNEFLQDTTALKTTIVALAQYESILEDLNKDYKEFEKTIKEVDNAELRGKLDELNSLGIYMKNNLNKVADTRELLMKYYTKDTVDMSIDIDNNLLEFGTFLVNLDKKSNVVDSLFADLNYILSEDESKMLSLTKEETEKLKVVREKMLSGIFIYGYVMGNEEKLNAALNSNIMDAIVFNKELNSKLSFSFGAQEKLGMWGKEKLGFWGKEKLGLKNTEQLSGFWNIEKLGAASGTLNREKLGDQALGVTFLSKELAAKMNSEKLGMFMSNDALGISMQGNKYVFSKDDLGNRAPALGLYSNNQLQVFHSMANALKMFMGNEKLGIHSKEKLGWSL